MWSPRCEGNRRRVLLRSIWKVELGWWYKEHANEIQYPKLPKDPQVGWSTTFYTVKFFLSFWETHCNDFTKMSRFRTRTRSYFLDCCCSVAQLYLTPSDPMDCSMLGVLSFTISQSLPKLVGIASVMSSNHLILCHPLLLLPSIFPSIRIFTNESVFCIRWPQYWSFNLSMSLSNVYPRLISFMIDWFDLLAVQGTLESSPTPQFNNINSLTFRFF